LPPARIVAAVGSGDFKAFTAANGVGPKLAQRLVLELKDKVAKGFGPGGPAGAAAGDALYGPAEGAGQAVAALVSLGYTQGEAAAAVAKIDPGLPVAEIIRLALQGIGAGR
ncbi:MAG: Holliday junction branch migration protein RuvA, partial [Oscillospiraceae bacterium]